MAGDTLDLSGAIAKLMADPSLLQSIASAIGGSVPSGESTETTQKEEKIADDTNSVPVSSPKDTPDISGSLGDILPAISKLSSVGGLSSLGKNPTQDSRACLLNALKPYMNPRRRDAIDKLIKFSGLSELLKKI